MRYAPGYTPFELKIFMLVINSASYILEIIIQILIFFDLLLFEILRNSLGRVFSKLFKKLDDRNAQIIAVLDLSIRKWVVRILKIIALTLVQALLVISCCWWVSSMAFLIELLLMIILIAWSLCNRLESSCISEVNQRHHCFEIFMRHLHAVKSHSSCLLKALMWFKIGAFTSTIIIFISVAWKTMYVCMYRIF